MIYCKIKGKLLCFPFLVSKIQALISQIYETDKRSYTVFLKRTLAPNKSFDAVSSGENPALVMSRFTNMRLLHNRPVILQFSFLGYCPKKVCKLHFSILICVQIIRVTLRYVILLRTRILLLVLFTYKELGIVSTFASMKPLASRLSRSRSAWTLSEYRPTKYTVRPSSEGRFISSLFGAKRFMVSLM